MLPFIPTDAKRILDVGCGEGKFGLQLKEMLGAEVWGVEMAQNVAEAARCCWGRIHRLARPKSVERQPPPPGLARHLGCRVR